MKLVELELKNFRQHLDTSVAFVDGVTGIIGPNGAGKSTILEAISWALYGAPAVRGTNDTIRSKAAEGGAKVNVNLTFELGGSTYRVARTLDGSGRSGAAVLEVDGRPLRSGMSEVSEAITKLLGMDYRAFFTSFFTGQKQIEFMAALDGRARANAISKMLGYDRVTRARDQANTDRLGLRREIEGLEKGLPDPNELKERKKAAESALAVASTALGEAESDQKAAQGAVDRLKPEKEAFDETAKRCDRVMRDIELARAEIKPLERRVSELNEELNEMQRGWAELEALGPDLRRFEEAAEEYHRLAELQGFDRERQGIARETQYLEKDVAKLAEKEARLRIRAGRQAEALSQLAQAVEWLRNALEQLRAARERKVGYEHGTGAQIERLTLQLHELRSKRGQIVDAGREGVCPTCERPLGEELAKVLANFDAQIDGLSGEIDTLRSAPPFDDSQITVAEADGERLAKQVEKLRDEKLRADRDAEEVVNVAQDREQRTRRIEFLRARLEEIPVGFDQQRYDELRQIGEDLTPIKRRATELEAALKREHKVAEELSDTQLRLDSRREELAEAEDSLAELGFSPEEHEKITKEFDEAKARLNAAALDTARRRGELNTASAVLAGVNQEEENYKSKLDELQRKRSERLHLQTLAEALDRLRADLNDRIRPELESIASELLSMITDGRYNTLEINEDYKAMIRDDGELMPVISGGEDDIVNLALRLAISQMIADRAGQSFSLLVLDEVFGSLDDTRRDNVVSLLQNLKHRFEQIILITHVESIHDAVDNCLWVSFDERTKTSRLIDKAIPIEV